MTTADFFPTPSVSLINDKPATTSLAIAEHFGKPHDRVLKDIRNLCGNCPETFSAVNFDGAEYTDEQGKRRPMFIVYFDGFILLVMGYTGKKALSMKLAYIAAFNAMRSELEHRGEPVNTSTLPASLQSELHALVDAKLSAFPRAVQGRARSEIWARFNRHFKIARYAQLPADRMPEARDYLIEMEVRALASLPASAPLPTPKQDNVPAVREKTYREQCAEVTARVLALRNELFRVSDDMTEAFRRPFWGTGIPDDKKPFASAMNYAVQSLYMAVNKDLEAIQLLFTAYVEGEAILNGANGLKFV